MPSKTVTYLLAEFQELRERFDKHIEESGEIRTDIKWLKWLVMGITGGWGAILVAGIIWIIQR